jgi:hypothetical protein
MGGADDEVGPADGTAQGPGEQVPALERLEAGIFGLFTDPNQESAVEP